MIITQKNQTNALIGKFLVGAPLPTRHTPQAAHILPELHAELLDVVKTFLAWPKTPYLQDDEQSQASSFTRFETVDPSLITLHTDAWAFGTFWPSIQNLCQTSENLYEMIRQRHQDIREIRESMRPFIPSALDLEALLETGSLVLNADGISGSYLLLQADGTPQFVIKPLDEDIGALHNPKGYASPFAYSTIRTAMPLYRSCFREVVTYEIASLIGVPTIVPPTRFAILKNEQFFDLSQMVRPNEMGRYWKEIKDSTGEADKEKLCSVQQFVGQSKTLFEAAQDLQMSALTDEEIEAMIDQQDFEEANILLWVTGDTDGHMGNFLVTPKRVDEIGHQIFGLKKIDNGLVFPEANECLVNSLIYLPNAQRALSSAAIAKIEALNPDTIADTLEQYGLEGSIQAMRNRIQRLKEIVWQDPLASIQSIHKKLADLG